MNEEPTAIFMVSRDKLGDWLLAIPGRPGWINIIGLVEKMAGDEDNGRARLLELWPDCPREWQDKILAALNVAPMLLGAS